MNPFVRLTVAVGAAATLALSAHAQQGAARPLSLADAIRLAERGSENLRVAAAGVDRAEAEQLRARSQYLPQVYGSVGYTRTLKSQFEGAFGGTGDTTAPAPPDSAPVCAPRIPDNATPAERQAALDMAYTCQEANPFAAFGSLPFGQKNQWSIGLSFSQPIFSGGRIIALNKVAGAGRRTAGIALAAARAQLILDVTQAYYDAVLTDRLASIADSSLSQTENVYRQTTLARQVGSTSEFDLLRAQVTRDNQRPAVIQTRAQRDVAHLRLKQMLNLPLTEPLDLTDDLGDGEMPAGVSVATTAAVSMPPLPDAMAGASDTTPEARSTVKQAADLVSIQEGMLRIARSQRLPNVTLSSQYGKVAYPQEGVPGWSEFLSNWTVTVGLQVPIFTGFRITGDERVARANLTEARARLEQTRELASLDAKLALAGLAEAEASWAASVGTVSQASRAYTIADLRYREGISTQIELSESRILLQQSLANRAMAARNLAVARAKVALLRDLPIGVGSSGFGSAPAMGAAGGSPAAQSAQQQLQQYQQQQQQQTQSSATGPVGGGSGGTFE